jgi:hypothetical protein
MVDKKELKKMMGIGKQVIPKDIFKKIKSIKDNPEKFEVLKYSIDTSLSVLYNDIKDEIKKLENQGKDVFVILMNANLLESKIKLFSATLEEKDFKNILNIINAIKMEIENV